MKSQVLGSAIEEFFSSPKGSEAESLSNSSAKQAISTGKAKSLTDKVSSWFSTGNKDDNKEQTESSERSIGSSLKGLFVK